MACCSVSLLALKSNNFLNTTHNKSISRFIIQRAHQEVGSIQQRAFERASVSNLGDRQTRLAEDSFDKIGRV